MQTNTRATLSSLLVLLTFLPPGLGFTTALPSTCIVLTWLQHLLNSIKVTFGSVLLGTGDYRRTQGTFREGKMSTVLAVGDGDSFIDILPMSKKIKVLILNMQFTGFQWYFLQAWHWEDLTRSLAEQENEWPDFASEGLRMTSLIRELYSIVSSHRWLQSRRVAAPGCLS